MTMKRIDNPNGWPKPLNARILTWLFHHDQRCKEPPPIGVQTPTPATRRVSKTMPQWPHLRRPFRTVPGAFDTPFCGVYPIGCASQSSRQKPEIKRPRRSSIRSVTKQRCAAPAPRIALCKPACVG